MANKIFLEKSYILVSILNVKKKYFSQDFVTIKELNYISSKFQEKLNKQNYNVSILDKVDSEYFDGYDLIKVNESNGLSLESIIGYYYGYLDLSILYLIWDEEVILNYLSEFSVIQSDYDVVAIPCSRAFVVSDKWSREFKNKESNLNARKNVNQNLKINSLVNEECFLNKTKKLSKK